LVESWSRFTNRKVRQSNSLFEPRGNTMKLKHAVLVLAGVFCITAPAWSDTTSPSSSTSEVADSFGYSHPNQFEFSQPRPEYRLTFDVDKRWDDNLHRRKNTSDPPADPTPEPSTLILLGSGLIALLGSAQLKSLRRSPPSILGRTGNLQASLGLSCSAHLQ
jgi:hypothetical protein